MEEKGGLYLVLVEGLYAPQVAIYNGDGLWIKHPQSIAMPWKVTEVIKQLAPPQRPKI